MIFEDKGHESIDDPMGEIPQDSLGGAGGGSRGREQGKGTGWAKGLLIREISKEGPISNIVRVLHRYPINPCRLSNQCHTGADRCTPTLPR